MDRLSVTHASDGTTLSMRVWGDTQPGIVLIHGFADASCVWTPFAESLSRHASVLCVDLRGHGDSGWDPARLYVMNTFVADVRAIVRSYCGNNFVLVGHSLGAEIAIRVAATERDRVRGLVLVDGGPGLDPETVQQMRHKFKERLKEFESWEHCLRTLRESMPLADSGMLEVLMRGTAAYRDERLQLKCDPELTHMAGPDQDATLWALLESLRCPSFLIRGEGSAYVSRRTAAEMSRRVAKLSYETIATSGHAVMMDNPRDFGAALERIMGSIYRTSGGRRPVAIAEPR